MSSLFPVRKVSIAGVNVETQYHGSYLANIKYLLESNNAGVYKIGKPHGLFKVRTDMVRTPLNGDVCDLNVTRMNWSKNANDVVLRVFHVHVVAVAPPSY